MRDNEIAAAAVSVTSALLSITALAVVVSDSCGRREARCASEAGLFVKQYNGYARIRKTT